jgi:ubiquinone/menaquinone biosynthesis C-methylase UbiE
MLRRELTVGAGFLSQEDLGRLIGATAEQTVRVLCDLGDGFGFRLLVPGVLPEPGRPAVVYAFDPRSDEDRAAVNAVFSDVFYREHDQPWPDEVALIEAIVPERDADLLEVCCGAGRAAPTLLRAGNRVTAIDAAKRCIARAKAHSKTPVTYQVADASQLPFPDASFDMGFCFENTLGGIFVGRVQVLAELIRVSRRAVVLGFRETGSDEIELHASRSGYLEFAQAWSRASVERLFAQLPPQAAARIQGKQRREGTERPWGGREHHLVVDLR